MLTPATLCGCGCGSAPSKGAFLRGHNNRARCAATVGERFWARVQKTDGCWLWLGVPDADGYGRFKLNGRNHHAHRVAWILTHGPVANGLSILHGCDNPGCVRPDHLRPGTQTENIADKVARNRQARGSRHGCSKLTEAQVLDIVGRRRSGESLNEIALRFGISMYTVVSILKGESWSHVTKRGAA